jgi:tetratricopeptide (TPR) repeat protein
MNTFNCPICFKTAAEDRFVEGVAYCECGHSYSISDRKEKGDFKVAVQLLFLGLFAVGAVVQVFIWDTYALKIVVPKIKQLAGIAKPNDLNLIAQICNARKNANCEVVALLKSYDLDKTQVENLIRAGDALLAKKRYRDASRVYATYFEASGRAANPEVRFNYALALTEVGLIEEAKDQYARLLDQPDSKHKFNIARNYVDLLMKTREHTTARRVIAEYRNSSPSASMFMDKEWKQLTPMTGLDTNSRLPANMARASLDR